MRQMFHVLSKRKKRRGRTHECTWEVSVCITTTTSLGCSRQSDRGEEAAATPELWALNTGISVANDASMDERCMAAAPDRRTDHENDGVGVTQRTCRVSRGAIGRYNAGWGWRTCSCCGSDSARTHSGMMCGGSAALV
jgi:hypothetical protein